MYKVTKQIPIYTFCQFFRLYKRLNDNLKLIKKFVKRFISTVSANNPIDF